MIEGRFTVAPLAIHNRITEVGNRQEELKPMAADGVALLIDGLGDGFIVGTGLAYKLVNAGAHGVDYSVLLLMIRVVSLRTVQGCDSFALV